MRTSYKVALLLLLLFPFIFLLIIFFFSDKIAILNPSGIVALEELYLLVISTLLMLIIIIPVFIMLGAFTWAYRSTNKRKDYAPNWDNSLLVETLWWSIPIAIILALSALTWRYTHRLDPFRPLAEVQKKSLRVQVVALPWRWLFIYPDQKIATLNFLHIPQQIPIHFDLTADAPMNSFWIPQLSGQIYAMPGMRTELNVMADRPGTFRGLSANISGRGFARMTFMTHATSEADFDQWVQSIKQSPHQLNLEEYRRLAQPSEDHSLIPFVLADDDLFDQIVMKYMMPPPSQ